MTSQAPVVERIRIIPRPQDFLTRNVGSSGQIYFNKDTGSLRVYNGITTGGFEIARADLNNVSDTAFLAKANSAGIGSGGGASVDVSVTAPEEPTAGNLWLNTENGRLYIYINDGDTSQWMQPSVPQFSGDYADLVNKPALAPVAISNNYNDLINKPTFGESGFDGSYDSLTNTPNLSLYQLAANAFSGSYTDLTDIPETTTLTSISLTGTTTLQQTAEVLTTKTGATGVVDHDCSTGVVFSHSTIADNFAANFTNVPTTNSRTTSVVLILNQSGVARLPTAMQINGLTQTINWQGGSIPSGNPAQIDIVSFTMIRISDVWTVIGSLTTYGS
jgi:hypothetical protein